MGRNSDYIVLIMTVRYETKT